MAFGPKARSRTARERALVTRKAEINIGAVDHRADVV
jgi:hypothetical protein